MKNNLRRILSCALALSLACALAVPAAASQALGDDLTAKDTLIHQDTQLSTNVFWSSAYNDLRTENVVTYTPNSAVTPLVAFGGVLTATNTVTAAAQALESQGYRVVAGMNGDFYNVNNGLPIGIVVSDGELKSSDGGYYGIGFRADGTAVLGKPQVKVAADLGYELLDEAGFPARVSRQLAAVNKARVSTGGLYLYTYDFNAKHTTGTTESGTDLICTVQSGTLSLDGAPLVLTVDSVNADAKGTAVPQGKVVLSANNKADAFTLDALRGVQPGFTITLSASAAEGWSDVRYAVGSLYALVENGAVGTGLPAEVNPRTAVGQKADGTLVFYTIDGRRTGHSVGASFSQVAQRMIELGCVTAMGLDGGGSTAMTVTAPDSTAAKTVNKPSGGAERSVSNQIFLVGANQSSGRLGHFYVSADNQYVLAGSKVNLSASAVDTNFIPMGGKSYELDASAGTISGDVLTTPAEGGDVTVTASGSGGSGSTVVHAVATPDAISVSRGAAALTAFSAVPGASVTLTATAVYNHLPLKADPEAFAWTVSDPALGSFDKTGKFTAGVPGTGTVTVSAGGKSVTLPLTVSEISLSTVEDFEAVFPAAAEYSYGAVFTENADGNFVKYGRKSGRLAYTFTADGTATLAFAAPYSVTTPYTQINLWVCGDGSNNAMTALVSNGTDVVEVPVGNLDFTGWKQLSFPLPQDGLALNGFKLTGLNGTFTMEDGSEQSVAAVGSGTLYLDQIVASYNSIVDTAAPLVEAALTGAALTAAVSDPGGDKLLPRERIAVTMDGKAVDFTYDAAKGTLTAALTIADANAHRITVTARDASGNIGRASCDATAAGGEAQFTDTAGYWAGSYVDWLKSAGITTGYEDGTFRPNQTITRQQFSVMLFRYLGLDEAQYEGLELPFADSGEIADYAKTAVKALCSLGIAGGSEKDGKLYFNPGSNLSRAQAATMIGRTQARGYAAAELSFTDNAAIPAYAAYYIQTMLAQKVVGGYEDGAFRPNANITRGQMAKILYSLL